MPLGSRLRVQLINSLVVSFSRSVARLDGVKPSRGARFSGGNASSSTENLIRELISKLDLHGKYR